MEKTEQQEFNDNVLMALTGLSDAMKTSSESRESLLKLLQFEGFRIDALENKIDILMSERAYCKSNKTKTRGRWEQK